MLIASFQIKSIVTPKRVLVTVICTFIALICSGASVFHVYRLGVIHYQGRNRTVIGFVPSSDQGFVERITSAVNSAISPFAAFLVISVCTVILTLSLREGAKWRETVTNVSQSNFRNLKVAKMVVMVSAIFIFCFIHISVFVLAQAFEPGLNYSGKYQSLGSLLACTGLFLESLNSSANIFIYYKMSGNYRNAFLHLLRNLKAF